ncbi:serine/threonine protein phosphatase PrpC [Mobilisporobacter senegalensis]|uniref:Serine/threonine protein phosphatase PrpC n=1 Tax=Mobilisporobacter senegalensis TaxID=1329262 RepID=A0A3N1XPY3_9FIRM|nr:PP2C family serine/threonine-protein phosphatase [Mobilisporobacter senegalensis]ROR28676.1 serine/threonine protein phosphatase PrpC [Mobilisporobacter senegalensis]
MRYLVTAASDKGIKKPVNQDSLTVKVADTKQGQVVLAVICDGMGGLEYGEVASSNVIKAFEEWFYKDFSRLLETGYGRDEIQRQWENIVSVQNNRLMNFGRERNIRLGTTVTAMLLADGNYYIIHIGDTRAYEVQYDLKQLTIDQTVIEREISLGNITAAQAKKDARRNVLLQCVGASDVVFPEFIVGEIKKDAVYMLCSDGFRHEITDQEIAGYFTPMNLCNVEHMSYYAQYLVELNKSRMEQDNISVLLIRTY